MHFLQRLFPVRSRESFSWFLVMEVPHPSQATSPSAMTGLSGLAGAFTASFTASLGVCGAWAVRCSGARAGAGAAGGLAGLSPRAGAFAAGFAGFPSGLALTVTG